MLSRRTTLRSLAVAALLVLTFALPASAGAVDLTGGTNFGGGAIPTVFHEQLVSLRLNQDASRANAFALLVDYADVEHCGSIQLREDGFAFPVRDDGSFAVRTDDGRGGLLTLQGRFVRPDKAVGTVQATYKSGSVDCDTGEISWTAFAPSLGSGDGRQRAGAFYGGTTDQTSSTVHVRQPVALRLSPNGGKVAEIAAFIENSCQSDPTSQVASNDFFEARIPIRNGSFNGTNTFELAADPGETVHFTSTVKGSFHRHRVTGTWKVTAVIRKDSDNSVVDRCGGDTKRWQAMR